jgi:uncharacterized GH25 family protein
VTTIRGQVVDPSGQPVAEASVYIVAAPVNMPDIAQLTDNHGQFVVSAPVAGLYTIGVRTDRWGSAQIDVEAGDQKPVSVEVKFS